MYPLGEQFQMDYTKTKANPNAVLQGNHYRITILTERLIRLEYHPKGLFLDAPTQLVLCRNFDPPSFTVKEDDRFLEVSTKYFKLEYEKEHPFKGPSMDPKKYFKITLTHGEKEEEKIWYYGHPEVRNYKGLERSFDFPKEKNIHRGLYSLDGFVSIDDSQHKVILEDGTLADRDKESFDVYVFCYKQDFLFALEDYYKVTGYPPLVPRYVLGNWWCRDQAYDQNDVLELICQFERDNIPLSILLLDHDWHTREGLNQKKLKTGFTFQPNLFPNPIEMIQKVHEKNVKIGLKINPRQGLFPYEMYYSKACEYLGITDQKIILFDPLNPKFLDVYMKLFLHPLESFGIDFFWNDYDDAKNLSSLWLQNHYQFLDSGRDRSKRSMLLSRNASLVPHRYPVVYSGKTEVSWDTLRHLPEYHITAANSGTSWISADVGGHYGGIEESELYIRSIELGVFSPILRFHAGSGHYYKREPWLWDIKTQGIVENYLRLRHQLIPYLYTEAYLYHKNGSLLIRPFYYDNPWVYDDDRYKNQYYLGSQFLVAPILNKKDPIMNRTIHSFFIPKGTWYDFKTGKKFPGPNQYVSFFKEEDYPVFVEGGSIIPLSSQIENGTQNPKELEIHFFPGKNNQYILYEDDGISSLYKDGYYLKTVLNSQYTKDSYKVIIQSIEGRRGIVPDTRDYKIRFRNTKKFNEVVATFNEAKVGDIKFYVEDNDSVVELKNIQTIGKLVIECKGQDVEIDAVRLINEDIDSILMDLQIKTDLKEKISEIIFGDLSIKQKRIAIRKLSRSGLDRQYVKLFLKLLEYIEQI